MEDSTTNMDTRKADTRREVITREPTMKIITVKRANMRRDPTTMTTKDIKVLTDTILIITTVRNTERREDMKAIRNGDIKKDTTKRIKFAVLDLSILFLLLCFSEFNKC